MVNLAIAYMHIDNIMLPDSFSLSLKLPYTIRLRYNQFGMYFVLIQAMMYSIESYYCIVLDLYICLKHYNGKK